MMLAAVASALLFVNAELTTAFSIRPNRILLHNKSPVHINLQRSHHSTHHAPLLSSSTTTALKMGKMSSSEYNVIREGFFLILGLLFIPIVPAFILLPLFLVSVGGYQLATGVFGLDATPAVLGIIAILLLSQSDQAKTGFETHVNADKIHDLEMNLTCVGITLGALLAFLGSYNLVTGYFDVDGKEAAMWIGAGFLIYHVAFQFLLSHYIFGFGRFGFLGIMESSIDNVERLFSRLFRGHEQDEN